MPPPAIPVDFRPPSDFNFTSQNGPSVGPSCSFNTGFPSSSSSTYTSFSSTSRPSSARPKPKPRLVKQRKSAKSSTQPQGSVDAGINPFRSVSYTSTSFCNEFVSQFESSGFVFGVSKSSSNIINNCNVDSDLKGSENVDLVNKVGNLRKQEFNFSEIGINRENNSSEGVAFGGAVEDCIRVRDEKGGDNVDEFGVLDKLNKLNIDNVDKGSFRVEENGHGLDNADFSKGEDRFFVFKTGGVSSDARGEILTPLDSDGNARSVKEDGNGGSDRKTDGVELQNVDNVFVFGNSAGFSKPGDFSSQFTAFSAENERSKVKKDALLSSFSFSSLETEVGTAKPDVSSSSGEKKKECYASGMPEGLRGSFTDFDCPLFDPSLSSTTFSCGFGIKPESSVRNRGLKDRNLKKPKGKSKQSRTIKAQPVKTPVNSEGGMQGQEAAECYSPMDFSPYEDATNSVVPPSDPPACGNPSAVPSESELKGFGTDSSSKMNGHGGDSNPLSCSSDETNRSEEKFMFASSTNSQNHVSPSKRIQRRKYRMKPASISAGASRVQGFSLGSTPLFSKLQGIGGNTSASASKDKHETEAVDLGCESYSAAEKACEKWRKRGNEAYEKGELSKAEDFYTWGVNCVPLDDASGVAFRPLVRCYSNRAATRMALGRVREAIQDCLMAIKFDPSFHKAQIRAANCYLQLGEVEAAIQCFDKCMGSGNVVCLDRQVVISASEGIQKSQKVIECTSRSAALLKLRTSEAATDALQYIAEAMSISIYSEKLLELKAQALCILSRHEEVLTLCQKTLNFAEKNFTDSVPGYQEIVSSLPNVKLWRYRTLVKCQFHLGNLEAALDLLENQEFQNKTEEISDALAVTIHELLKLKSAGNNAFHSGKHVEAIEHYTSAIYNSMESRPFAAICLCNRAAAYQALGQITDAIADCSLAMALDENYVKAVSRRATLHEMIRDYKQAAADLQKLLSLQKQSLETSKSSGSGKGKELRQVQQRLSVVEEEAKKDIPLNLYLILGSKKSDSISEIKKAYRKAALKHHPDKAAQSLVKSGEVGEEGRHWKDIAELVHKDSDRLFKIIGEAYAVLSDDTKREEYDLDEDMRKALKEDNNVRTNSRRYSEQYSQGYPFERSSSRRYWQDSYRTYSHSHRR